MVSSRTTRGQQTVVVASSFDKHKLWLIIGIVLAAVLVLLIVFLSPAREALFGKAVLASYNPSSPARTNNYAFPANTGRFYAYVSPHERCDNSLDDDNDTFIDCNDTDCAANESCLSASSTPRFSIPPLSVKKICMNIQILPFYEPRSASNDLKSTIARQRTCQSSGCFFVGNTTPSDPGDDRCLATRLKCPQVELYLFPGGAYNDARKLLCQSLSGCYFYDGGNVSAMGDVCIAERCDNTIDDDADGNIDCSDRDCSSTRICTADTDSDGILDRDEVAGCAEDSDCDDDGVADGTDSCPGTPAGTVVGTDGCPRDADADGIDDSWEDTYCAGDCDPAADSDGDGASNLEEYTSGINPTDTDTDDDGVLDGNEEAGCAASADCDEDSIADGDEESGCVTNSDCDGDGVPDDRDDCAGTPPDVEVDGRGCTHPGMIDEDEDGVDDNSENALCRATPLGAGAYTYGPFAGCLIGDVNVDGTIDPNDIGEFIYIYNHLRGAPGAADLNQDLQLDPNDIGEFIFHYNRRP